MPRAVGRRKEIHETFIRHVAERGYHRANFTEIASELGISTGTIVYHFGTKAQMLCELEEVLMREQLANLETAWQRLERPEERIAALICQVVLLHVSSRDLMVAAAREVVELIDDPAMLEVRKQRRVLWLLTQRELSRGIELGVVRPVNVELAAQQIWGTLHWLWVWFHPDGRETPEEVAAAHVDLLLGGLLVDRLGLATLADPRGHIFATMRGIVLDADGTREDERPGATRQRVKAVVRSGHNGRPPRTPKNTNGNG